MGEHKLVHSRVVGKLGGLRGGQVTEAARKIRFALKVCGLDHKHIRTADVLLQACRLPDVANVGQTCSIARWSEHVLGLNYATVGQRDRLSGNQCSAVRSLRHAQPLRAVVQERAPWLLAEDVPQAWATVPHREGDDLECGILEKYAGLHRDQVDVYR